MIERGSLVQMVNMDYEYGTGFNKDWLEGAVGVVTDYHKVTNINYGYVSEICCIKFITPVVSLKGNLLTHYSGIRVENLREIIRVPITTPIEREPIISQELIKDDK